MPDLVKIAHGGAEHDLDLVLECSEPEIETANEFAVVKQGEQVVVLGIAGLRKPLSRAQAANLAAHLVWAADPECLLFDWILEAII